MAFTPDGRGLVSGSLDKTLKYWDISRLPNGPGGQPNPPEVSKRDTNACTMSFVHKVRVESADRGYV